MRNKNQIIYSPKPGSSRRKILAVVGFILMLAAVSYPQSGKYARKSVAFVDALMITDSDIRLSEENQRYLLNAVHESIRIPRFDYNPLPEAVQTTFKKNLQTKGMVDDDQIAAVIRDIIAPEIIKYLDVSKELRAQNLVSEVQKNSFIAVKAKELGVTAEQMEQVMNSSYIYVPFISKYKLKKEKDEKDLSVSVSGGLIWFHIIAGDEPQVEKLATIRSDATSSAEKKKDYDLEGAIIDAEEYAYRTAVQTLTMNLQVLTRGIDMFKLTAPIADVDGRTIRFPLSKSEGIRMDEPFFVGEYSETKTGKIKFRQSGFVRVGTVSDPNKPGKQLSTAWAVKKGDWVRGMTILEHPRIGVDISVKPRWFKMDIKEGIFLSDDFLIAFNDYSGGAVGIDFDMQWNIAELTKKRQSFLVVGGTAGATPVESKIYDLNSFGGIFPNNNWAAGILCGYLGYMRKFYLGPMAIHAEALAGIQHLVLSDTWDDETVTISNNSLGARVNLGLEYAVNIDWNVGIFAGMNLFPAMDWWTVKYKDKEVDVENYTGYKAPRISSISPTYGFYIHYSIPTLSVNPGALLQKGIDKKIGNF
ncbi:MAG: hypothetical protein WC602_05080 [archaeon]